MKSRVLTCLVVAGMALLQIPVASRANDNRLTPTKDELSQRKRISTSVHLGGQSLQATIADTKEALIEGLLGWSRISEKEGMLLDFTHSGQYAIHMQGMKFPIDALWIDEKGIIKLIYEDIPPNSGRVYPSLFPCRYCLEIKAGFCSKYGVKAGQALRLGASGP